MDADEPPTWEELIPRMNIHDQMVIAGMLAWNRWVDELTGMSDGR